MRKLKKDFYSLREIPKYSPEDLIYFATQNEIELCVYVFEGFHIVHSGEWTEQNERDKRRLLTTFAGDKIFLPAGCYPILLLPGDRAKNGQFTEITVRIIYNDKPGYIFLEDGEYAQELCITHKELERFETAYKLASGNNIKKKRPAHRVRSNEIHDVIWRAYCDLKKRFDAPTSGQVWQKLVSSCKAYDTEDIVDEVTKERIIWTNYKGSKRTLKESSFKATLSKIKDRKKINKNSN